MRLAAQVRSRVQPLQMWWLQSWQFQAAGWQAAGWLRAAWLAQELLSSFSDDLARVSLEPATGGTFRITCDGVQVWERKADGGFPEAKELKQRVRDLIDPQRDLGHNDR